MSTSFSFLGSRGPDRDATLEKKLSELCVRVRRLDTSIYDALEEP